MDERNDYNSIPMQNTQTAVGWLECELKKIPFINVIEVFEQAKQMEKEQMLKSSISGSKGNSFENYFNQTYQPKSEVK